MSKNHKKMVTTIKITCDGVFIQSNPYLSNQSVLNNSFRARKEQPSLIENGFLDSETNSSNQKIKYKDNCGESRIFKSYPTKVVRSLSCLTTKEFLSRQEQKTRNKNRKSNSSSVKLKPTFTKRCSESRIFHLIFRGSDPSSTIASQTAVSTNIQQSKHKNGVKRSNSTSITERLGSFAIFKNEIKSRSKSLITGHFSSRDKDSIG